jgi:hypothetical protein
VPTHVLGLSNHNLSIPSELSELAILYMIPRTGLFLFPPPPLFFFFFFFFGFLDFSALCWVDTKCHSASQQPFKRVRQTLFCCVLRLSHRQLMCVPAHEVGLWNRRDCSCENFHLQGGSGQSTHNAGASGQTKILPTSDKRPEIRCLPTFRDPTKDFHSGPIQRLLIWSEVYHEVHQSKFGSTLIPQFQQSHGSGSLPEGLVYVRMPSWRLRQLSEEHDIAAAPGSFPSRKQADGACTAQLPNKRSSPSACWACHV